MSGMQSGEVIHANAGDEGGILWQVQINSLIKQIEGYLVAKFKGLPMPFHLLTSQATNSQVYTHIQTRDQPSF